jgi:3-phosphoglycerate kinase
VVKVNSITAHALLLQFSYSDACSGKLASLISPYIHTAFANSHRNVMQCTKVSALPPAHHDRATQKQLTQTAAAADKQPT